LFQRLFAATKSSSFSTGMVISFFFWQRY